MLFSITQLLSRHGSKSKTKSTLHSRACYHNYFVATQPKRWSCSLILTTVHLYTPNYLLIRLLAAERSSLLPIWCGDLDMHTYHNEMQVTMATSNFLVNRPLHYYYLRQQVSHVLLFLLWMWSWRWLRSLAAGLTKHKFHRDAFERRFRHHRQPTALVRRLALLCISTKLNHPSHEFEYNSTFVCRDVDGCDHRIALWREISSWRGIWNRMQLTESHCTVQLAHTKWSITRHNDCVSSEAGLIVDITQMLCSVLERCILLFGWKVFQIILALMKECTNPRFYNNKALYGSI